MAQNGCRNNLPLGFASKESDFLNSYPQNQFGEFLYSNSSSLEVSERSNGCGNVRTIDDLRSSSQGEETGSNSPPALVEQPITISSSGLKSPYTYHVIREHSLTRQTAPRGRIIGATVTRQDCLITDSKTPNISPNIREFVFDTVANTSTPRVREISSYKGRTGPMSPNSRANTKSVKDAGGACWRCKFVGKGCDAGDPCSSCPQKSTPWHVLGCKRGTLWDVLPRVVLCPLSEGQPGSILFEHPKMIASDVKEHEAMANLAGIYLPHSQGGIDPSLSNLLPSAARYQTTAANDELIELSLLCLQASLGAIQEQEDHELRRISHSNCTSSNCNIDSFNKLNAYLKEYIKLLSDVFFKKHAKHRKDWWLSVFYSFCIQSFVRRALMLLVSNSEANQATAASQYLHLAVNLFFVACNANAKGYDPLSYDFGSLSVVETSLLTRHYLQVAEGKLAQVTVQKDSWESGGVESSYDYLGQLFGMDRTIFVPPTGKPPAYGDGSEQIAIVDEFTQPPPKKRRLDQQNEGGYDNDDSNVTQIPDTHIIHPGSLFLLDLTVELPPPVSNHKNHCRVRENLLMFEGDMYTPRWVRGFRDEEGWCGFCSRWLKLGDAWFNDRCLFHGICAETGKGFAEPKEPEKIHLTKQIWEAKCETCEQKVRYRKGDRRHYSGWFVHAVNCGNEVVAEIDEKIEDDMVILTLR